MKIEKKIIPTNQICCHHNMYDFKRITSPIRKCIHDFDRIVEQQAQRCHCLSARRRKQSTLYKF